MAGRPRGDHQWLQRKLHPLPRPTKHSAPEALSSAPCPAMGAEQSPFRAASCHRARSLFLFGLWISDRSLLCTLLCSSWGYNDFAANDLGRKAVFPRWQRLLSPTWLTACTLRRGRSMWSAWISESLQHCPKKDPSLWQWHTSPKAAAENKTEHGWSECRDLRAGVAQQCYCKDVKLCTVSFTGAFTLTPAVIKLHDEKNTLWSSHDSPVLWHPGRGEHLAGARGAWKEPLLWGVSGLARRCFRAGWAGQDGFQSSARSLWLWPVETCWWFRGQR